MEASECPTSKSKKPRTNNGPRFGAVSALFIRSFLKLNTRICAVVIGYAVVPTMIANASFMPRHLLRKEAQLKEPNPQLAASHN
jgi:hypothetical protein